MLNLLLDRQLRHQPRTCLIISISVVELIVAGILCPLYTDSLIRGPWRHGLLTCSVYEAIFYLQVCISSLAVLVLNVERLYFLLAPRMLTGAGKLRVIVLLTLLPWMAGIVMVVPLYTRGAHAVLENVPGLHHRTCVVHWERDVHVLMVFICFLAPAFLLLATAMGMLLLYVIFAKRAAHVPIVPRGRNGGDSGQSGVSGMSGVLRNGRASRIINAGVLTEANPKQRRESLTAVLVSSGLCVGLQFPFFAVLLLQLFCHPAAEIASHHEGVRTEGGGKAFLLPDSPLMSTSSADSRTCQFSDGIWAAVMMTGMAKPGLTPLVWLIYSDIRAGLKLSACSWRRVYRFRDSGIAREVNGDLSSPDISQPSLESQITVL